MNAEEFLFETVSYFAVDPNNRRCFNEKTSKCSYSPKNAEKEGTSKGCAIGMWLEPAVQEEWDGRGMTGITHIMNNEGLFIKSPEWMQQLDSDFLAQVQCFHDYKDYWKETGLSLQGKRVLNKILERYDVPRDKFTSLLG